jgi:large conductance mechanosensitive channel
MLTGFKDFIAKGNVVDVAAGFVAGAAFVALISGITGAIITPLIGLISGGGVDAGVFTANGQVFDITAVINAIITFILTMALLYFVFVSPMNHWRERNQKGEDIPAPPTDVELLTEIRDLLKRNAT